MRKEAEIKELLKSLQAVGKYDPKKHTIQVFCLRCQEGMDWVSKEHWEKHRAHPRIFTDIAHDSIREWIECLKWVLGEGKEEEDAL